MAKDKTPEVDNPELFYRDADLPAYYQALADAEKDPDKKADLIDKVRRAQRAAAMTATAVPDET